MPKILIVEDNERMASGLEINLRAAGHEVVKTTRADRAVATALQHRPDLILLDIMLQRDSDGLDVCRDLRRQAIGAAIILLTARSTETDKVLGLESGADDYVTKPFSLPELMARVRANLRRGEGSDPVTYSFGGVEVDFQKLRAVRDGRPLSLTTKEFQLLRMLIRLRGRTVSRERLLREVWGFEHGAETRTVDTHILNLRRKVERDCGSPEYILTVHGDGYLFAG